MKLYIGFFEGNHWAVESEREKPKFYYEFPPDGPSQSMLQSAERDYEEQMFQYDAYINSLPRILCSDSLVQGLKVGDELPPCEEGYEVKRLIDKNSVEYYWAEAYWKEYSLTNPDYRRIILVPVEAKQEQEEHKIFKEWSYEKNSAFIEFLKEGRLFYVDEVRKWLNVLLKEEISFSKFVELFNEKVFERYANPKPQEQGEDELWTEVEWDLRKSLGIDNYRSAKFVYYIKQRFTITRKQ